MTTGKSLKVDSVMVFLVVVGNSSSLVAAAHWFAASRAMVFKIASGGPFPSTMTIPPPCLRPLHVRTSSSICAVHDFVSSSSSSSSLSTPSASFLLCLAGSVHDDRSAVRSVTCFEI
ncbi:expressed unknown protein [Seminavis robusta]|uniref:Uncharacterized protein n=1 Tax=Seminavis robusta TaxID=568900 RepID=A0A9N8HG55_9STRA|nr:expressed unknown protein [Seminavis robusta]|eukprot:Sro491_g153682.1  (117) ;mRNA; r:43638-43988